MLSTENILQKAQQKLRYAYRDVACGNGKLFDGARGKRILIYHGISLRNHTRFNPIFLTAKMFEEQIRLFKKHANIVSLDEYYSNNLANDRFNICITFDDGFANNFKYVLPLLEKYKVPAAFFVTGIRDAGYDILWNDLLGILQKFGPDMIAFLGKNYQKTRGGYVRRDSGESLKNELRRQNFEPKAKLIEQFYSRLPMQNEQDYWLQMTPEEIKMFSASPFVTIGCHGYYHNDLAAISADEAKHEMSLSKAYLEGLINKDVKAIAFPYGSYSAAVIEAAKSIGFTQLLAMDFLFSSDEAEMSMRERFTVNPFVSPVNQLFAAIKKTYAC